MAGNVEEGACDMTRMTEDQKIKQADQILDWLVAQVDKAHADGPDHLHNFLHSTAFAMGVVMTLKVTSKGLGPMMNLMIESIIAGIEAGVQHSDLPGTLTVVRRTL